MATFFSPVTVWEANDLEDKTKSSKVLETSENAEGFQLGPINGKLLKR